MTSVELSTSQSQINHTQVRYIVGSLAELQNTDCSNLTVTDRLAPKDILITIFQYSLMTNSIVPEQGGYVPIVRSAFRTSVWLVCW